MVTGKVFIDSLRDTDGCLSLEAIKKIIPYGNDFLFVNRITKLLERNIEAEYRIDPDQIYLKSHFVGFPLMPGVLISEGFAQAGTVLVRYHLKDNSGKDILICRVEDARFRQPAFPGNTVRYKVQLDKLGSRAARIKGEVGVGTGTIANFSLVLTIVDRKRIQKVE